MNDKTKINVLIPIIIILLVLVIGLSAYCFILKDTNQKIYESYWREVSLSGYLSEKIWFDDNISFNYRRGGNGVARGDLRYHNETVPKKRPDYGFACDSDGYCWEGKYRGTNDGSGIQYINNTPIDNPFMPRRD